METDDLPLSNLSPRSERETIKRISNSRVFLDSGFTLFEYRDWGYESKMAGRFGFTWDTRLPKINIGIAEKSEIKDGVKGSEDCIKETLAYLSN